MPKPFLRQLIEEQVAQRPDQNFLNFKSFCYSYQEIDQGANRVAHILSELGLKANDRLLILLPNSPDFIFCWFATIKLNITLIPVNVQLKGEALRYIISHAAPHLVITNANLLVEVSAVAEALPAYCRLLVLNNNETLLPLAGHELFDYRQLFEQAPTERPAEVAIDEDDTALIIYTSGTTGHPKGVMLNRRAQTNHPLYYHKELILTTPEQVAYTYLPLFHVTSMGVTMGSFINGARLALDTEFNVLGFWERIRRYQAVVFPYLGAVLSMLYARPPREDDTNHPARWALGGAAPKEIWAAFERRFGVQILETYGQSEWGAIWLKHPVGQTRIGAAGQAPARAEVRIVDENDQPLSAGQPGQIIMRPNETGLMMSGYYQQPELNAHVFKDGWYYTGDIGVMDEDGYIFFKGRLKDYIRRRGENISAFEIERVVAQHPAILEVAAVGVPSALGEEEVKLCAVLKPGENLTAPQLWEYFRANLPAFMVPRYIQFLPELPHTATQRVRKFMLTELTVPEIWDCKAHKRTEALLQEKLEEKTEEKVVTR